MEDDIKNDIADENPVLFNSRPTICRKCHTYLNASYSYCPTCGTKLEEYPVGLNSVAYIDSRYCNKVLYNKYDNGRSNIQVRTMPVNDYKKIMENHEGKFIEVKGSPGFPVYINKLAELTNFNIVISFEVDSDGNLQGISATPRAEFTLTAPDTPTFEFDLDFDNAFFQACLPMDSGVSLDKLKYIIKEIMIKFLCVPTLNTKDVHQDFIPASLHKVIDDALEEIKESDPDKYNLIKLKCELK